jgi:hypothetical protein
MRRTSFFAWLLAILLAACNPVANFEEAEKQVGDWQENYNAGDAKRLYAMGGETFREQVSREDFDNFLKVLNGRLGKSVSSESAGKNVSNVNGTTHTIITMNTEFEQGAGVETFTFEGSDADMRLLHWNVDSPRLAFTADDIEDGGASEEASEAETGETAEAEPAAAE